MLLYGRAGLAHGWRMVDAWFAHGWRMAGAWLAHGWRSGESARLPPMCSEFDFRTARHMKVEFAGSLPCSEGFFSRYSGFPVSSKTSI